MFVITFPKYLGKACPQLIFAMADNVMYETG